MSQSDVENCEEHFFECSGSIQANESTLVIYYECVICGEEIEKQEELAE